MVVFICIIIKLYAIVHTFLLIDRSTHTFDCATCCIQVERRVSAQRPRIKLLKFSINHTNKKKSKQANQQVYRNHNLQDSMPNELPMLKSPSGHKPPGNEI